MQHPRYLFLIFTFYIIFSDCYKSLAQSTESLTFLTIGGSAQHIALNEGTTAIAINGSDLLVNPSLIQQQQKSIINANYTSWISGTINSTASFIYKSSEHTAWGWHVISNSTSDIEARDVPGEPSGTFSVDFLSISGAFAKDFGLFTGGITLNYIFEHYLRNNASGYGINLGVNRRFMSEKISIGASLNNLGKMGKLNQSKSKLPLRLRTGGEMAALSFSTPGYRDIPMVIYIGADITFNLTNLSVNDDIYQNNQTFIWTIKPVFGDIIVLSTGFRIDKSERFFSAGLGIKHNYFQFDFAYQPLTGGYADIYSLGLSYRF